MLILRYLAVTMPGEVGCIGTGSWFSSQTFHHIYLHKVPSYVVSGEKSSETKQTGFVQTGVWP